MKKLITAPAPQNNSAPPAPAPKHYRKTIYSGSVNIKTPAEKPSIVIHIKHILSALVNIQPQTEEPFLVV